MTIKNIHVVAIIALLTSLGQGGDFPKGKTPARLAQRTGGGHGPTAFTKNPSWEGALDAWLKRRGCM